MRVSYTRIWIGLMVAGLMLCVSAPSQASLTTPGLPGTLTQLPGKAGCVAEGGNDGCGTGRKLFESSSVAASPDGRNVYVASRDEPMGESTITVFKRTANGELIQLDGKAGCVSDDTSYAECEKGRAFAGPYSVAVSPDGRNVYVAGDGVAIFKRDPSTGALRQLPAQFGCINKRGFEGCAKGRPLNGFLEELTSSPDGKNVYLTGAAEFFGGGSIGWIAIFHRDPGTGALEQVKGTKGCMNQSGAYDCEVIRGLELPAEMDISPDGKNGYVASLGASTTRYGAVGAFSRDKDSGALTQLSGSAGCIGQGDYAADGCAVGRGLDNATSVAISPDGKSIYIAALGDTLAIFTRDPDSGRLSQLQDSAGCISDGGNDGCAKGRGLLRPRSVAVSSDGRNVYVASEYSDAVAIFARDAVRGSLLQWPNMYGCISQSGNDGCAKGRGLLRPYSVTTFSDAQSSNQNVYVPSRGSKAVAIFKRELN